MAENKPVDLTEATPLEPGDPVPADAITQQGSTFAERAKAAAKQVDSEGSAENKSVAPKKTSRKKKS